MQWQLRDVEDVDCTLDDSGVYVIISRVVNTETHKEYSGERVLVRADLMESLADDSIFPGPIMSWIGTANAVRKHLIRFIDAYGLHYQSFISREHASYIGYELLRAESDPNFIQN